MSDKPIIAGYVRCGVTQLTDEWRFEVHNEQMRLGVLVVETNEGELSFGIRRESAAALILALKLFLADQREGGSLS